MRTLSGWIRGPWLVALLVASLVLPETTAEAGKGGKGGGRGGRAPRQAAPRRPSAQAFKMPRASNNAARVNVANNRSTNVKTNGTNARNANGTARSLAGTSATGTSATTPGSYAYGSGSNARRYTANGYGQGYRNRSSSRGYGRSQGNARALVSRLRSVHTSLARLDHDYRGHRVNAMHAISSAIRSLSHRSSSMVANGNMNRMNGNNLNGNNLNGNNGRNRNVANNNNNGQRNRMTQAQSDARMSQALRTTQGIHMQMVNQGSNSSSSGRTVAHRHVLRAINEMHTALAAR
jgi:hypothetical protein